mgnify:CR=1 FL=1
MKHYSSEDLQTENTYKDCAYPFNNFGSLTGHEITMDYSERYNINPNFVLIHFKTMNPEFIFSTTENKYVLVPQEENKFKDYFEIKESKK